MVGWLVDGNRGNCTCNKCGSKNAIDARWRNQAVFQWRAYVAKSVEVVVS